MIKNKPLAYAFLLLNIVPMTALRLCHLVQTGMWRLFDWATDRLPGKSNIPLYAAVEAVLIVPIIPIAFAQFILYPLSRLSEVYHEWVTRVAQVKLHWSRKTTNK